MKLSEIKGEKALEALANLIDPISIIAQDEQFKISIQKSRIEGIKHLLKNHKKAVIEILAILNEENPETYEPGLIEIPSMLLEFFSDPQVAELFGLQDQTTEKTSSGPVTENTEAPEA